MQPEPAAEGTANADGSARDQMITDATVAVDFQPAGPGSAEPVRAVAEMQNATVSPYYEADLTVPTDGEWNTTITVDGAAGQGRIAFDSAVLPARTVNWILLASIGLVFTCIIAIAGLRARSNSARAPIKRKAPVHHVPQ
jgi:hypothetical protein